jgi:chromosomal replication initiator protein
LNYIAIPGIKMVNDVTEITPLKQVQDIFNSVIWHFGLRPYEVLIKNRHRQYVYPRQIIMFLLRKHTDLSYMDIGELFNRDHTSVIHAKQAINDLLKSYPEIEQEIKQIEQKFSNGKL